MLTRGLCHTRACRLLWEDETRDLLGQRVEALRVRNEVQSSERLVLAAPGVNRKITSRISLHLLMQNPPKTFRFGLFLGTKDRSLLRFAVTTRVSLAS